jgi:uncharacterized membrane protein YuzA (DUF378 family)
MKAIRFLALLLMVIGSLNLGLMGFFQYNLLGDIMGGTVLNVLYALIGLAGLCGLLRLFKCCCKDKCGSSCSCGCHSKKSR